MTNDQIAELEQLHHAASGGWELRLDDHVTHNGLLLTHEDTAVLAAARNALPRLLEERRRLVAALRGAAEFDPITNEDFGRLTTIRDALAFAEDPA